MSFFNELKRRNVIRMAIAYSAISWLLIQVTETLFPLFGFVASQVRIVVIVLAIGFIPAMILSWVFKLTAGGLQKETIADAQLPESPDAHKSFDRVIILALVAALAYFAFDKFVLSPQRQAALQQQTEEQLEEARKAGRSEALAESYGDDSIAVLAFDDMSQAGDQEYLSDGIAEELLNLLAKIPELRVISRSSAFSYKNKDVQVAQIARELNVAHILEGSVRKSGDRIRITVQLIDARSDSHLWSETYDRTPDDILAVQDEIAQAVVRQLKIKLLGEIPAAEEIDSRAYALLLQARYLARQGTAQAYEDSIKLYQQALEIHPDYLSALDGLAANYINQANKELRPFEEGYALARQAAEQALAIDPGYAQAHARLGWMAMIYDNDLALAARHLERALELAPTNLTIIGTAATLLSHLGRQDESIALDEYVNARDPINPTGYGNLGKGYLSAGRWDAAIDAYQAALRLSPDRIGAHYYMAMALLFKGQAEEALQVMQQESYEILQQLGLAIIYFQLEQTNESDRLLAEVISAHEQDAAYNIAYTLASRGETDRAFEWLEKARAYNDRGLVDILAEPLFQNLHGDPRWKAFLESIDKSPGQLAAIPFKVNIDQLLSESR
ncbi:MAG TPA: tetratricopeptide repeat protein [Xanthomonadales bacterium]|nr:tetratricopeptide repeat protein [Xanthomonadales bacterium]